MVLGIRRTGQTGRWWWEGSSDSAGTSVCPLSCAGGCQRHRGAGGPTALAQAWFPPWESREGLGEDVPGDPGVQKCQLSHSRCEWWHWGQWGQQGPAGSTGSCAEPETRNHGCSLSPANLAFVWFPFPSPTYSFFLLSSCCSLSRGGAFQPFQPLGSELCARAKLIRESQQGSALITREMLICCRVSSAPSAEPSFSSSFCSAIPLAAACRLPTASPGNLR